ncbi:MAG: hypothetical protein ACM3VT_20735, partial [Solirubrobacterales bacterium]
PTMDPWASDSTWLRRAGIPTYGVSGTFGELGLGNAHGANERLSIESFDRGVEFLHSFLRLPTAGDSARISRQPDGESDQSVIASGTFTKTSSFEGSEK